MCTCKSTNSQDTKLLCLPAPNGGEYTINFCLACSQCKSPTSLRVDCFRINPIGGPQTHSLTSISLEELI